MKRFQRERSVFLSTLLTLLTMVSILLAVFLFVIGGILVKMRSAQIQENNEQVLNQTQDSTELILQLICSDMNQLLWDDSMVQFLINPTETFGQSQYDRLQTLQTVRQENSLIRSIWIYSSDSGCILCSDGNEYTEDEFPDSSILTLHEPSADATSPEDTMRSTSLILTDGRLILIKDMVLARWLGSVCLEIDLEELYRSLGILDASTHTAFYTSDGRPLAPEALLSDLPECISRNSLQENTGSRLTLSGRSWYYTYSQELGLYIFREDTATLNLSPGFWLPILLPGILIFLILGILGTYLVTRRIYSPVNQLVQLVLDQTGDTLPKQSNELDYLQLSFFRTVGEQKNLRREIDYFARDILEQIFHRMLDGSDLNTAGWTDLGPETRGSWENCRHYTVLACRRQPDNISGLNHSMDDRLFRRSMEQQLANHQQELCWVTIHMDSCLMAIILGTPDSSGDNFRNQILRLEQDLEKQFLPTACPVNLEHGLIYPSLEDIPYSWQEALQKSRYSTYLQNSELARGLSTAPDPESAILLYYTERSDQILDHVLNNRRAEGEQLLSRVLTEVFTLSDRERPTALTLLREAFLKKRQTVCGSDSPESDISPEVAIAGDFGTVQQYFTSLLEQLWSGSQKTGFRYIENALRYIQEHASESELSAPQVAEYLRISSSYFSELFNEHRKESFSSYLNRVRVDNARRILTETTMPIKDVGFFCGFNTVQHFNRMFKKHTGMTPKQYRDTESEKKGGGSIQ